MRAMKLSTAGENPVFELFDKPEAELGPNDVRIAVRAASINTVDTKVPMMPNLMPSDPAVLGCDVAGTISETGSAVTGFSVGDAVYGCAGGLIGHDGAYTESMVADARLLAAKPAGLSFLEVAALPLVSITAWEGLVDRAQVKPGDLVLVHGGAGGVGHIGIQLAKALGATVHATVSTDDKAAVAEKAGADKVIRYRDVSVEDYVREETDGRGYDVVFDTVGGPNIAPSLEAVATNGRVVTIVSLGSTPDLSPLHLKNASLHVVFMLIPLLTHSDYERHADILMRIGRLTETGALRPTLDASTFGLADVKAAHARLLSGQSLGKVVLNIKDGAEV
ncbi:MAG: zinc-binding dehydrogenase [Pseudomonadota bacterium]